MAQTSFLCLLLLLSIFCTSSATTAKKSDFIKTSCGFTQYPDLCFESLSVFRTKIQHSPKRIVGTALSLSLSQARDVRSYVSKMTRVKGIEGRDLQAVKSCVDLMHASVYSLRASIEEFNKVSNNTASDIRWSIGNVDTWVNSAATDGSNCINLFLGDEKDTNSRYRVGISRRVGDSIQVTDNALALFEHFFPKDQH